MKETKKISIFTIFILLIGSIVVPCMNASFQKSKLYSEFKQLPIQQNNDKDLIKEYTWAVLRYDSYYLNRVNYNFIQLSTPTDGPLMVTANFMSPKLCKVALQVYNETEDGKLNKYQTLKNLAEFAEKSMIFHPRDTPSWDSHSYKNRVVHRTTAHEGMLLAKFSKNEQIKYCGGCYSQSSFCTAVLRLCGFKPEEVFNVFVSGWRTYFNLTDYSIDLWDHGNMNHVVNLVNADEHWYVIDSVDLNATKGGLFTEYRYGKILLIPHGDFWNATQINRTFLKDKISLFDNDYYHIGGGWSLFDFNRVYSNMDKEQLGKTFNGLFSVFVNARFKLLLKLRLLHIAKAHKAMSNVYLPYTVKDAVGDTIDEKAEYLAQLNREFILNHTSGNGIPNQYNKALYAYNLLDVAYPQVYANAARLADKTCWFGHTNDKDSPFEDVNRTINFIRNNFKVNKTVNADQIAFSDLTFILKNGSTLDHALFAYGAIRNMKKEKRFWFADDLFVIVTNENRGYLAVNVSYDGWIYLNFGEGEYIQNNIENVSFAFNEKVKLEEWNH